MNAMIGRPRAMARSYSSSTTGLPEGAMKPARSPMISRKTSQLSTASRQAFRGDVANAGRSSLTNTGCPPAATIPLPAAARACSNPWTKELTITRGCGWPAVHLIMEFDITRAAPRARRWRQPHPPGFGLLPGVDLDSPFVAASTANQPDHLHTHLLAGARKTACSRVTTTSGLLDKESMRVYRSMQVDRSMPTVSRLMARLRL